MAVKKITISQAATYWQTLIKVRMNIRVCFTIIIFLQLASCVSVETNCPQTPVLKGVIEPARLMKDLEVLSNDNMQGRETASEGSLRAQDYIISRFKQIGLAQYRDNFKHHFEFGKNTHTQATNLIGWIEGTTRKDQYIVVTAHYDHLGKTGNKIYNGADDNASGVAAMIHLAEYLNLHRPQLSVIFVATDAEEKGLHGAKAFMNKPPVKIEKIVLNLNLDMVARGGKRQRIYLAGTKKNPQFKSITQSVISNAGVCVRRGHDGQSRVRGSLRSGTNWANASDHSIFAKKKIPYLYFGVDLHQDYHQPADTFQKIDPLFFSSVVETIIATFNQLDLSGLLNQKIIEK